MATKKSPAKKPLAKKSPAKPAAVAAKPAKAPAPPSYEDLLQARRDVEGVHDRIRQAERELRSARTINTFSERDSVVELALEKLATLRSEATELTIVFEEMKVKARKSSHA